MIIYNHSVRVLNLQTFFLIIISISQTLIKTIKFIRRLIEVENLFDEEEGEEEAKRVKVSLVSKFSALEFKCRTLFYNGATLS